jgi:hypothetical protein
VWASQFMYECVMGLKKVEGNGVILADEMCVPPLLFPLPLYDRGKERC